jgi:hypothetical protein
MTALAPIGRSAAEQIEQVAVVTIHREMMSAYVFTT